MTDYEKDRLHLEELENEINVLEVLQREAIGRDNFRQVKELTGQIKSKRIEYDTLKAKVLGGVYED